MSHVQVRTKKSFHQDPKFGRILLLSLILHALIWAMFTGGWFGAGKDFKPPVYYVDLIHKPVLNPQAGRPDPRPAPKPKAAPVKRSVSSQPSPAKEVNQTRTPIVKPTPQKAEPKPAADTLKKRELKSAIDEIRERQSRQEERDVLKDKIAQLRQSVAATSVAGDVPVGMPDGSGDEVGISALAFVQAFIQENWTLSPYLLDQAQIADLEAKASMTYSTDGTLVRFRLEVPSGNSQFDESLKKAIVKSKQLPQPLPSNLDLVVTFNLKEMAASRR
jgi:hypothetical protein